MCNVEGGGFRSHGATPNSWMVFVTWNIERKWMISWEGTPMTSETSMFFLHRRGCNGDHVDLHDSS